MKPTLSVVAAIGIALPAAAQPAVTIIARSGTAYPTLPSGTVLGSALSNRTVDESGTVAFTCSLVGVGAASNAIVIVNSSGPRVLVKSTDPAPGALQGQVICVLEQVQAIANGASVSATLSQTTGSCGSTTRAIYRFFADAAPQSIALIGQPAFGIPGTSINGISTILNHAAVGSYLINFTSGAGQASSIFSGPPQAPTQVARIGDPAPGLSGRTFEGFHEATLSVNNSANVVFRAHASNGSDSVMGIWATGPQGLVLVTPTPTISPSHPGREVILGSKTSINSAGAVVLDGYLQLPGGVGSVRSLWLFSNGSLQPIAVEGETAPGTEGLFCYLGGSGVPGSFDFNESGEVAFIAGVCGRTLGDDGLWAGTPGRLRLIARRGAPVPGLPAGYTYGQIGLGHAINARGQVAFLCSFSHPTLPFGRGIFVADRDRDPVLIVKTGDAIPAGSGSSDVIAALGLGHPNSAGGQDGRPTIFNDSGRLVFGALVQPSLDQVVAMVDIPSPCYANCDYSNGPPLLTANDFICFLTRFAQANPYANCDGSTTSPILTANDFACFLNAVTAGCP